MTEFLPHVCVFNINKKPKMIMLVLRVEYMNLDEISYMYALTYVRMHRHTNVV